MDDLSECRIAVVDDIESNIDILVDTLGSDYEISVYLDGKTALQDITEDIPDLILLDIMMPDMDGYEVCKRLKADETTKNIPVIFLTAMTEEQDEAKGLALGAVDYVIKPFNPGLVKSRVRNQLELKRHRDHLEEMVRERTRELELTQEATIESMALLAEYRDPETGGHIQRTKNYMKVLAEHLKNHPDFKDFLTGNTIELLCSSAPLHDIGKVGIEDSILLKPGRLTDEEFEKIEKHTIYGRAAILAAVRKLGKGSFLKHAEDIAYTHHEKWDGSGYPRGLKNVETPIPGRMMALADVYDAMISRRVYKKPFAHSKAVAIISEGKGRHFDPEMVDAFLELQEEFRRIALKFADFDEERETLAR